MDLRKVVEINEMESCALLQASIRYLFRSLPPCGPKYTNHTDSIVECTNVCIQVEVNKYRSKWFNSLVSWNMVCLESIVEIRNCVWRLSLTSHIERIVVTVSFGTVFQGSQTGWSQLLSTQWSPFET